MIHPAVVVAFADNAPVDPSTGLGAVDLELARAFAGVVRSQFPHITRGTLRETAAAAFARVTLLGTQRAVAYLHDRFREWPAHARRAALSLAADLAKGRASRDPRAIAMRMLDDALG
jgi:hypothetical protein